MEKTYTVNVICPWCNPPRAIGKKSGMKENKPTHGICPDCKDELLNPEKKAD